MQIKIITPEDYAGNIMSDLNRRRGVPKGQDTRANGMAINALSAGRASASMEFSHYAAAPKQVVDEVVKRVKGVF